MFFSILMIFLGSVYLRGASLPVLNEANVIFNYVLRVWPSSILEIVLVDDLLQVWKAALFDDECGDCSSSCSSRTLPLAFLYWLPSSLFFSLCRLWKVFFCFSCLRNSVPPSLYSAKESSLKNITPLSYNTFNVAYTWLSDSYQVSVFISYTQCFTPCYAFYPFQITCSTTLQYFIEMILLNKENKCKKYAL